MSETTLLTIPEVAEVLRKKYRFVLNELTRGHLRGSHFGGQWHVKPADLETYIESHANVRAAKRPTRRSA